MSVTIPPRAANAYIGDNLSEVFWKRPLHQRFAHEMVASAAEAHIDMASDDDMLKSFDDFADLVGGLKEVSKEMLRDQLEDMYHSICTQIDELSVRACHATFDGKGFVDGTVLIDVVPQNDPV